MNQSLLDSFLAFTQEEKEIVEGKAEVNYSLYVNDEKMIIDSEKLVERGKLIDIRPHTRFVHFPKHRHNYVEVVYMYSGSTTHIINDETVILEQGEILFLNQQAVQEILPAGERDIGINFIILPEFFDKALLMMGEEENRIRDFIIDCLHGDKSEIGYLHFKVSDVLPIQNLMENLIWTISNKLQNKRSINQVTMGLLFIQLLNQTENVTIGKGNKDQDLIMKVYRYVEDHYKEGDLTALSKQLNYDLYTLSRFIRKRTGITFTELIQTKRLSQAAYLLRSSRMAVSAIGESVGYSNLSYFHKLFKSRYGVTPSKYR